MACSPNADPDVMRVSAAWKGKATQDDFGMRRFPGEIVPFIRIGLMVVQLLAAVRFMIPRFGQHHDQAASQYFLQQENRARTASGHIRALGPPWDTSERAGDSLDEHASLRAHLCSTKGSIDATSPPTLANFFG